MKAGFGLSSSGCRKQGVWVPEHIPENPHKPQAPAPLIYIQKPNLFLVWATVAGVFLHLIMILASIWFAVTHPGESPGLGARGAWFKCKLYQVTSSVTLWNSLQFPGLHVWFFARRELNESPFSALKVCSSEILPVARDCHSLFSYLLIATSKGKQELVFAMCKASVFRQ